VDSEALPQWVIELEIEAWVPAEEVRNIYQYVQRDLLAETAPPKTTACTFRVAQFVWEEELRNPHEFRKLRSDKQLWPALLERWNERNPHERFKSWRAFRTCCERGKAATPPRYRQNNAHIASEAREHIASEVSLPCPKAEV
jgi:hypothetical protein